jgi:hypothetical protein
MFGIAWHLTVPYLDFAGEQRTTATFQIVCRGEDVNGPWLVERVEQVAETSTEPAPAGASRGRLLRLLAGPDL